MQRFSLQSVSLPVVLIAVAALLGGFLAGFGIRSEMVATATTPGASPVVQIRQGGYGGSIPSQQRGHSLLPGSRLVHGLFGTVVKVSSSSVTVRELLSSKSVTVGITASTVITAMNGRQPVAGGVPLHSCVVVREGTSGSSTVARAIRIFSGSVNPCTMLAGRLPAIGGGNLPGFPTSPLLPAAGATPSPSPGSTI